MIMESNRKEVMKAMSKRYYQMLTDEQSRTAEINIYGDITSVPYFESDMSSYTLKEEIDRADVDAINVYINSYGGEVGEALAIYSALRRHKATVHTFCDGFACSAASVIFCAGEKRTMGALGLLMIHNCMSAPGYSNAKELRKAADDLDVINQSSIEAYKQVSVLEEKQIKKLMDSETWISAAKAVEWGFATDIADSEEEGYVTQSALKTINAVLTEERSGIDEKLDRLFAAVEALRPVDETPEEKGVEATEEDTDEPETDPTENHVNPYRKAMSFFGNLKNK